jgi:hypothetical protein
MGNSSSLDSGNYGQGGTSLAFLQKIFHLTSSDLRSLHSIYSHSLRIEESNYDHSSHSSHSSRIHYFTFCSFIHCEESVFTNHLFSFFSSFDSSVNSLTFNEFILFLYFFLSLNEKNMIEFLYFLIIDHYSYQKKHLPPSPFPLTIEQSIHDLFGNDWGDPQHIHHILSVLDHDLHGELTFQQFRKGLQSNRSLLFRVVSYQMDIRSKIFSESYWEERAETTTSLNLVRKIRKIRNQLHRLEKEDFLHLNPSTRDLEELQLKSPAEMEAEEKDEDAMDPRSVSLPVANHKRGSYELSEQELFYRPHTSSSPQRETASSASQPKEDNQDDLSHLPMLSHPLYETTLLSLAVTSGTHQHQQPHKMQPQHKLPGLLIPEASPEFPALLHPLTDHSPPRSNQTNTNTTPHSTHSNITPHSIHTNASLFESSSGVSPIPHDEKTEGSSQIHSIQRLRTSHQQHHPHPHSALHSSPGAQTDSISFDHHSPSSPPPPGPHTSHPPSPAEPYPLTPPHQSLPHQPPHLPPPSRHLHQRDHDHDHRPLISIAAEETKGNGHSSGNDRENEDKGSKSRESLSPPHPRTTAHKPPPPHSLHRHHSASSDAK